MTRGTVYFSMCSDDAEETLYELGFGFDEPQVTVRIPSRFFTFPSQAKGINFRLFLDSQLCRIREEDPSLSLASKTMVFFSHCAEVIFSWNMYGILMCSKVT
uniref:ITPR-interacting domain-containing protein n=1 Tax=Echeneis naucrates TaxID=173247 RepID=A0A665TBM3_ECHNA